MKTVKVVDVSRSEGPLYTVMGEDELLYVFDSTVSVPGADGKVYVHKTFVVKGCHPGGEVEDGEWAYPAPNRGYKEAVEDFASKVRARGWIDLRYWEEVVAQTFEEREAWN